MTGSSSENKSELHPLVEKFTSDLFSDIRRFQIDPWAFYKTHGVRVRYFNGKEIRLGGDSFDGSTREVFWGRYIEPFLEDAILKTFEFVTRMCCDANLQPHVYFDEADSLLKVESKSIFGEMVGRDAGLRKGLPRQDGSYYDATQKISAIHDFIDKTKAAYVALAKRRIKSRLRRIYDDNQLILWVISTAIAGFALLHTLFLSK